MKELDKKRKNIDSMRGKHAAETRYLKEQEMKRKMESISDAQKVKEMDLEDIFFVLTRSGASGFTPMLVNSIESLFDKKFKAFEEMLDKKLEAHEKMIEDKLRQVASGISRGLLHEDLHIDELTQDDELVDIEEVEETPDDDEPKDMITVDDLEKEEATPVKIPKRRWTPEEDEQLISLVHLYESKTDAFNKFQDISGRTADAASFRWHNKLSKEVTLS